MLHWAAHFYRFLAGDIKLDILFVRQFSALWWGMSLDLFDLSFKPFTVMVDHDGDAVENTIAADHTLLAIPVRQNKHLPNRVMGLGAEITDHVSHEALVARKVYPTVGALRESNVGF